MSEKPLSLKVLKLLLAVWWWGLIVGAVVVVLLFVTIPTHKINLSIWGYASDIDTSAMSAVDRNGNQINVSFDAPTLITLSLPSDAESNLFGRVKILGVMMAVPYFLLCIYFVKQLREIVQTIDQKNPFVQENARRIRTVGALIFLYVAFECIGRFVMSGYADSMIVSDGFNLNGRINVNESLVVVAIAMIVLSEVFRHGSAMREEQSLTV